MAERPVALPPIIGGEANASDTTGTSNSGPPTTGLPKLLDDDGVNANQSRQAGMRDAHFLLHKVRQHGNQGIQNPIGKCSILHRFTRRDAAFGGDESGDVRF
jgi:hypothetical protein